MNTPPDAYVLVREEQLLAFSRTCFEKVGLTPDHARLLSRYLVNSDLRGVRSHGTKFVNWYCESFEKGLLNPRPDVRVLSDTDTIATVDGDGSLGYLPMTMATELAIEKAGKTGLGMATVRRIGHYGAAGHYCRLCVDAGCIGMSFQGNRHTAKSRGTGSKPQLGYIGNPPICLAFPSGEEHPVILDAATRILPDVDSGAQSDALLEQMPAAFFKSVGYVASALLLGGALAGHMLPESEEILHRFGEAFRGGMVLAISVAAVVSEEAFRAELDRLVVEVRNSYEPLPGYDEALLPGAIEEQRMVQYRAEGVRYGRIEQDEAEKVCARLGVDLPWA